MRLAPALTALLLAGCAAPPVFTWTDTGYGETADYYDWRTLDMDEYRKTCRLTPRSAGYNGGACAYAPLHRHTLTGPPARDINTHEPVPGLVVGALCMIYSSLSFPAAQFARSSYPGEWRTVLDHELEHCKKKSHPVYTIDLLEVTP